MLQRERSQSSNRKGWRLNMAQCRLFPTLSVLEQPRYNITLLSFQYMCGWDQTFQTLTCVSASPDISRRRPTHQRTSLLWPFYFWSCADKAEKFPGWSYLGWTAPSQWCHECGRVCRISTLMVSLAICLLHTGWWYWVYCGVSTIFFWSGCLPRPLVSSSC